MYSDVSTRLKSYEPFWENWYLDSYIGRGASSTVYKIKQNRFGSTVYAALKVISTSIDDESGINKEAKIRSIEAKRNRAEQEIVNMYKLNECPSVVHCNNFAIKDIYDEDGKIIGFDILIHMEYYTCFSKHMTKNDSVLSEAEVIKLAKQIGSALKAAHDINIIHRDIKPENFFIDNKGNYLLGDLGVSKQVSSSTYSTVAGTHPYMAPEIWKINQTKRYTKTADIYSFGIVLYSLLNNNYLPMVTKDKCSVNDIEEAINKRLTGSSFLPPENGSEELKAIVMKACQYDEKLRYQNMDEFLHDVNNIGTKVEKEQPELTPIPPVTMPEPASEPVHDNPKSTIFETVALNPDRDDESLFETEVANTDFNDESLFETEIADTDLDDESLFETEIADTDLDDELLYHKNLIENNKKDIDNSRYGVKSENSSNEETSETSSKKKSRVFRWGCIIIVIVIAFLIGVAACINNDRSDESDTYADYVYDYEEDDELEVLNESKSETTTTITTTTTIQKTTIEIILNEPYFIKYNKNKKFVAMYSEANTDSKVIKKLKPNGKNAIKVTVLSKDTGDLWKVKYDGKTGYIHKDNLVKNKQKATTAKPTTTTQPVTTTQQQYTATYQQKATTVATTQAKRQATKTEEMIIIEEF